MSTELDYRNEIWHEKRQIRRGDRALAIERKSMLVTFLILTIIIISLPHGAYNYAPLVMLGLITLTLSLSWGLRRTFSWLEGRKHQHRNKRYGVNGWGAPAWTLVGCEEVSESNWGLLRGALDERELEVALKLHGSFTGTVAELRDVSKSLS